MKHTEARTRPRIPAVTCGSGVSGARLERHLAVLAGPALSRGDTEEAAGLMRDLTARLAEPAAPRHTASVSVFAPLRRLRRSLFGSRR